MSSPLSMLKKTRRIPLQCEENDRRGKRDLPTESQVLDDPSPPVTSPTRPSDANFIKLKASKKGVVPSDFELMSSMMQRLALLERKVTSQKEEMVRKDNVILILREKQKAQQESGISVVQNFHMDFDLVIQTIKELNILAGEPFIQSTPTGAQLARNDPVQLKLYSNGIVMFNGPFRSYQEKSTQQCMQDLMEGYFPSELQSRFPDGVPFEAHDRRHEEFVLREPCDKFPGKGHAVREKKEESPVRVGSQCPAKPLSTNQFLNRLPKAVVKAGRVMNIRDSVRTTLQGSSDTRNNCSAITVDTPALQAMKDSTPTITSDRPASPRNIVTLKVKSEDGDRTYVLKMCLSETVGHLRQHLDTHRGHDLAGYDIISAYPQCHYHDDCQTLGSCGLTTNVTLLLRGRKNTNKTSN
ncbi:UBX domain-containing protein 11 isoform X2 [Vanacampus margaritifer]